MGASHTTKPFTTHPAFPAVVALWFAALLGLGTFVVPPANFEGLVVGTGLDRLIPAAAPPLGATARIAISAIAALLGAVLGLAIAARIRRSEEEPRSQSETAAPPADSLWLADDVPAAAQDYSGAPLAGGSGPELEEASDSPDIVPAFPAYPPSPSERDGLDPAEAAFEGADDEPGHHTDRIFQAGELASADAEVADDPVLADEETSPPEHDEEDEDLQRFAADRLVAGLPRVPSRNFDENPLEDWSHPGPHLDRNEGSLEDREADDPAADGSELGGPDFELTDLEARDFEGPDFDTPEPLAAEHGGGAVEPAALCHDEFADADHSGHQEPEGSCAAHHTPAPTPSGEDLEDDELISGPSDIAASSLSELVERFDAALAALRSPSQPDPAERESPSDSSQSDDPVIAFLRREADRDRGAPGQGPLGQPGDPHAVLRDALDKLDQVSRKA